MKKFIVESTERYPGQTIGHQYEPMTIIELIDIFGDILEKGHKYDKKVLLVPKRIDSFIRAYNLSIFLTMSGSHNRPYLQLAKNHTFTA